MNSLQIFAIAVNLFCFLVWTHISVREHFRSWYHFALPPMYLLIIILNFLP